MRQLTYLHLPEAADMTFIWPTVEIHKNHTSAVLSVWEWQQQGLVNSDIYLDLPNFLYPCWLRCVERRSLLAQFPRHCLKNRSDQRILPFLELIATSAACTPPYCLTFGSRERWKAKLLTLQSLQNVDSLLLICMRCCSSHITKNVLHYSRDSFILPQDVLPQANYGTNVKVHETINFRTL